jgi:hypothetical protein
MSNSIKYQETKVVSLHSCRGWLAFGARTPNAKITTSVFKGKYKESSKTTLGQSGTHGYVLLVPDGDYTSLPVLRILTRA